MIKKLKENIGLKVYPAIILRLHSKYYMCGNCETGMLGEQNSTHSKFLLNLHQQLQTQGFILSQHHPLRLITCISAENPAYKMPIKDNADHHETSFDVRVPNEHAILERTSIPANNLMTFNSQRPKK